MPRGEPRSVPDQAGERYDEMMRQERLKRQRAEGVVAKPAPSPFAGPISPFASLDAVRQAPRPEPLVTIGGQTYRGVDNGRANVLVPLDDPLVSPAERAEQRRGIERAFFMADHPLGSGAYDVATLANASPGARDGALVAGGVADAAMMGAAPRGAPVRGRPTVPRRPPDPPALGRPGIRPRELNADGDPTGVNATLTTPMLGAGTRANWRLTPPGWQGNGRKYNEARAHLLAKDLGGSGSDMRNIVTMTHNGANTPQMRDFEREVARRVRSGEVVEYSATPLYNRGGLPPSAILLTAPGSRDVPSPRMIQNPAGRCR
jgi:hypothetical protein